MKRILLSTALALATTGAAFAQDADTAQLRELVSQELSEYGATDVTVDDLTSEQVSQLYFIFTSTDSSSVQRERVDRVIDEVAGNEPRPNRIRTYRVMEGDEDVEPVSVTLPRNQLRALVSQMLETYEVEVDVATLTDEQLTELYIIDTSSDSESVEEDRIRAVLNQ
ncbi:hypothetical protein [Roseitranquillus sediminis]|uniref:hypothetical protein n=1 Tax=Roseitranquillus sediminis TaxID=2809051 RepID=UPI001D0C6350|nr:hypothetical protein [Roseitranquillus sediminis]MBM9593733.1 hypothetical protein [Roseitranquillus sediminis]